ncbi:diacylglycerol kinase theta-like [Rhincodon typus]|uniref:diacylglycerol kinase theta-like n=1 Tax=Rhincodon typus TaxID=259920 RepID=UPI002030359F|nr:diacylglycerol kinase theta-like [Rhincodon typus]
MWKIVQVCFVRKLQEAALRAYYIPDDPQEYELQTFTQDALYSDDIINRNGGSMESKNLSVFRGTIPEAWVLRAKPRDCEIVKIYPGWLKFGVAYISIPVSIKTTVKAIIQEVLLQLGRQDENIEDFELVEVLMGCKQVQCVVLSQLELMLSRLQDIRKMLPDLNLLFVSGAVVLEFSCFDEAERIYTQVKDTTVNDRQLTTVIIPVIEVTQLPQDSYPLLLFVNPKSGALKGRELLYSFRKLLNPHQVFDLSNGGPLSGLHTFREVPYFRILVCGGDGTVGWVLGVLEEIRHKLNCPVPPVAVLPLGTGNDLARVLRWGPGYSGEDPFSILVAVDEAEEVLMDRWTILLDAQEVVDGTENGVPELEPPKIVQMNNYCGIGIDAELSLDFHQAREEDPDKFNSRFHNKGVYVKVGLQKISHTRSLHKDLKLQVDDHEVALPNIEGLIFLNIPSWGSGADLWGSDSDGRFEKPRIDDGMLEVVGVTGVVHMGQVQSGLRSGIRIAQGTYFRVTLLKSIPVQVDGEPWIQSPGHIIISAAGPKVHMLKKCKQKQKKQIGSFKDVRAESLVNSETGNRGVITTVWKGLAV